ncbi:universal stress protein [Methanofollis fontis]|uniref:Universal stress protein n=1 Tax=Methanofollis fontis TaxID=2052832 RepID=A0A483CTK1_9EURY|nr:universal stress protein [Methanofollis fontis]TAJ44598.1 universal stress protein [Methanofollis fontis]
MKILALIDGSKWSHKGALHATAIGKKKGADVVLFSVLDRREARTMAFNYCTQSDQCEIIGTYEQNIWQDMQKNIQTELDSIQGFCSREGCRCTTKITEGDRRDEIVREIREGGYGLVVMGAYGRSGKAQIGSCLGEICGDIDVPALIVR